MFCTTVVNIFVSVFLILLARSSFGIERTERLLIDNDPNNLQVQVDHLMQELNALKSDANREISYLKSQLATQGLAISTCRGNFRKPSEIIWLVFVPKKAAQFFIFLTSHRFSFKS